MRHTLVSSSFLFLVSVVGLLVGCGSSPRGDIGTIDAADAAGGESRSVAGRWVSACVPVESGPFRLTFDNTDARWTLDYDTFGDVGCAEGFLTVHIEGPYEIGSPAPVPGAREARFGFDLKTVTPRSEAAVGFLSSLGEACGGPGTWERGVARDIGVSGCAMLGQRPIAMCAQDFDLVSVTDTELRFGERPADNDLCTVERRPTALAGLASLRQ